MLEYFGKAKTSVGADLDSALKWRQSNLTLHRLIGENASEFKPAAAMADTIRRSLESIFPFLDELARRTCPFCPEPCCISNKVWFDFIDLIFLHLIQTRIPPMQISADTCEPCRYLGHRGCRLPRPIRPWVCTRYLCSTQRSNLARCDPYGWRRLKAALDSIDRARFDLQAVFEQSLKDIRVSRCRPPLVGRP